MTTYRIYGHRDKRPGKGFRTDSEFEAYIKRNIFAENQGRYRYNQTYFADVIVMSREGKAYGHFEIERAEDPTAFDKYDYDKTKKVFIVTKSTIYKNRVALKDFGLSPGHRGLPIKKTDFDRIIAASGGKRTITADDIYEPLYCRVCYNTEGWEHPTGEAEETGTYYAKNGFGHEEWLLRYNWCLIGQKYGFLQPFTNGLQEHQGKTFSLTLYRWHRGVIEIIGTISKVYVPHDTELADAYKSFVKNGWLDIMTREVEAVEGKVEALGGNIPNLILNVRFDPKDVLLFKKPIVSTDPWLERRWRYKPYRHGPQELPEDRPTEPGRLSVKKREDIQQRKAAEEGTTIDPVHSRLQNRLYDWLCDKHGATAVGFEVKRVDLRVTLPGDVTFFEIKTDDTAKRCIRNAIGQLVEYATYPTETKADRWVVVGDREPTAKDIANLKHLRDTYDLPIYYARFDWMTGGLDAPV